MLKDEVREWRLANNISQGDMAARLNIGRTKYVAFELHGGTLKDHEMKALQAIINETGNVPKAIRDGLTDACQQIDDALGALLDSSLSESVRLRMAVSNLAVLGHTLRKLGKLDQ